MPKWSGYHKKTDGRTYFRLRIPGDLKPYFGEWWPTVNLGMKASREAERMALMHFIAVQGVFEDKRRELKAEAMRPRPLSLSERPEQDLQGLAVSTAQHFNRKQYAALRSGAPRSELEAMHEALAQISGDVLAAHGAGAMEAIAQSFLTARGIPFDRGHPSFRVFVFELAAALDEHFVDASERRLSGRHVAPPPEVTSTPAADGPKVAPALTLGAVIKAYIGVKQKKPTGYTRKVVRCLDLFREMVGADTPVAELRQRRVTDFLHDICGLPSDWATRFDQGEAVAKMLEEEADEVMGPRTFNDNYRAPLKSFLRDARRDYGDEGFPALIVDGIEYTGGREAGEDSQRDLTVAELQRLFEGAEFAAVARDPEADAAYWLPVIGLFTGARPREICQLNPQCDWGKEGETFYLVVDERTPAGKGVHKTVKTGEKRNLPLHSELVRLGLPAYLERMKKAGADRLFPGERIKKGNPYEVVGEAFTDFLKALGLYDNTAPPGRKVLGMYVFRKTLITYAGNRGIPTWGLTGHKPDHMTALQWKSYHASPAGLELVKPDLEKIIYPVNIPRRQSGGTPNLQPSCQLLT